MRHSLSLAAAAIVLAACSPQPPQRASQAEPAAEQSPRVEAQAADPGPTADAQPVASQPKPVEPAKNLGKNLKWATSVAEAKKVAKAEGKFLLMKFEAEWCGPCQLMKKEAFNDPKVVELLKDAVIVPIDIDRPESQPLEDKHGVTGVPMIVLAEADGKAFGSILGYDTVELFVQHMQRELAKR
jgi:thiol:disulfide interchange protein